MELFDKFKKKNELLDNEQNEEIEAPGWDAIDKLCDKVYPNQKNPKHYGAMIKWRLGGNDPLGDWVVMIPLMVLVYMMVVIIGIL